MIVTADAGSVYEPRPALSLDWTGDLVQGMQALSTSSEGQQQNGDSKRRKIQGETIHIYHGPQVHPHPRSPSERRLTNGEGREPSPSSASRSRSP